MVSQVVSGEVQVLEVKTPENVGFRVLTLGPFPKSITPPPRTFKVRKEKPAEIYKQNFRIYFSKKKKKKKIRTVFICWTLLL